MKRRMIDSEHSLHVIAAAVLVALGSSHAAAQQAGQEEADRPQTSQSQPQSQSQSQPSRSESQQDPASQQSASAQSESSSGSGQLDQIAQQHDDLSTFIEAVKAAGMEESLTGSTEYTVFAPTNDAWEEMSGLSLEELMQPENREQLVSLLRAHIVADDVDEQMARTLQEAQTIDGGSVALSTSGETLMIGDASVVESGIQEGSLRVYGIDQVLEPTALARADTSSQSGQSGSQSSGAQPGTESGSESGSQLDTQSESDSPFDTESERESGSPLDTESQRESGSPLDTQSPRESGSQSPSDDPLGSSR